MGVAGFTLGVLALTVVAPIAIIGHYVTKWRSTRGLSAEEERTIAELWETAERLRARVVNLERILDAEAPGWRNDT